MGRWESWKALRQWHRGRYVHRDGTRMQKKGRRVEEMLWQRSKARFSLVVIHNLLEMNVFIPLQSLFLYLFLFQLSDCILFSPSSLLHTTLTLPSTFCFFPPLHKDTGTKTTNQSKKTKDAWSHLLICIYYPLDLSCSQKFGKLNNTYALLCCGSWFMKIEKENQLLYK